jgi:hypothetical protein
MKIKATPIQGKDLKSGDLFSTAGPFYWNSFQSRNSIGEKVYIRTETPCCDTTPGADLIMYKIEIELEKG